MSKTGPHNGLTDVQGIQVGHYSNEPAASGVTVVLCDQGTTAGVDVRGSAPGTRETDLLNPVNLVQTVQAVVLSGGSVYGLASADGVVRWLEARGRGFPLDETHVAPIVPAAVLFDLGRGQDFVPPVSPEWGEKACEAASGGPVRMGCVGAGTGALSGGIKGGLGTASLLLDSGITVAALVAVNSLGSTIHKKTGALWEVDLEVNGEFGGLGHRRVQIPDPPQGEPGKNTSIGIVATDARLSKVQCRKVAQMAHDGLARAIRPCHTMFDGDTIFSVSTNRQELPETEGFFEATHAQAVNEIGHAAAGCMSRAVIHAILSAESRYGMTAFCDLKPLSV